MGRHSKKEIIFQDPSLKKLIEAFCSSLAFFFTASVIENPLQIGKLKA